MLTFIFAFWLGVILLAVFCGVLDAIDRRFAERDERRALERYRNGGKR